MAIQSQGVRNPGNSFASAAYGIYPLPTVRAALVELSFVQAGTSTVTYALGRPATNGVPSAPILFQQDDPGDPASVVTGHITWSAQPTAPPVATRWRTWQTASVVGYGASFTMPRGIIVTNSAPLIVWSFLAFPPCDINAVVDA